jgi:protein dithiol oxidoreductase (disulfide-forming)
MKRRHFTLQLTAAGLGLTQVCASRAQTPSGAPSASPGAFSLVEGKDFVRLQTPVATTLPAQKKIEVIEFFSYSCPHCFAFESVLAPWVKQLPADVHFRALPYAFFGSPAHQRMFYALEEMGQREALHSKLFNAIHVQKKTLNSDEEVTAFVLSQGVDADKYAQSLKSFGVNTKLARGKQMANDYKIDSVPTLAIHGRFYTSPALARSPERALLVADSLIGQARTTVKPS